MEVVETSVCSNVEDNEKVKESNIDTEKESETSTELNVCHKTNGVAEIAEPAEPCPVTEVVSETTSSKDDIESVVDIKCEEVDVVTQPVDAESVPSTIETEPLVTTSSELESATTPVSIIVETDTIETTIIDAEVQEVDSIIELDNVADLPADRVAFETEVLVETTVNDSNDSKTDIVKLRQETPDLLNELDQNIEFSEVLRSSDVAGNGVNNNTKPVEEVYNKKELLDILKGNDEKDPKPALKNTGEDKLSDTELALQQLSRLNKKKRSKNNFKLAMRRKSERKEVISTKEPEAKKESIVKALVSDWDDEEPLEGDQSNEFVQDNDDAVKQSGHIVDNQEELIKQNQAIRTSVDSIGEPSNLNVSKSGDESSAQPQRRLSRIIKKKVIFDPDNPDTFTKVKSLTKNKESLVDKDHIVIKKPKLESEHPRPKSKSPVSKMQWKKPSSKNSKQYKRLSEVDKLLMDEGAVNMIYQLTPEALKGKKNMRTKAEFIKKIQSTTPDSKEMKFRERKKELKEIGEAKKILGGKHRGSISSSIKSSVNEDFEAHSADDSIIYRRHSSSSYSSSCMSPRRLSDVDSGVIQMVVTQPNPQKSECETPPINDGESKNSISEPFLEDQNIIPKEINKDDCLSIKEKLNTKLSQALNKRRKQMSKIDKPNKQRKSSKSDEIHRKEIKSDFKYISIQIFQRIGEICLLDTGTNLNIQVIREIEKALLYLDSREDISVTLLLSSTGQLCLNLDLDLLLSKTIYDRANDAHEIAESIRALLFAILNHTKLLCSAVEKECTGLGFTLVALSDVTFASELATFSLNANINRNEEFVLAPGVAVLSYLLPQPLLNNVLLFGRQLPASVAVDSGLVSHCFWPASFTDQLQIAIKDIAAQSPQTLLLKKQLLAVKKIESMDLIKSSLEKEREMFVKYWSTFEKTPESH